MAIVKGCLANPTSSCSTYTGSTTLPVMVKNMEKCMSNWKDTTCSGRYTGTDSLPLTIKKVDGCMTDMTDSVSCPLSSYGKLLSNNGNGIVGYIQQLSKIGKQVSRLPMSSLEYFWGLTLNWLSLELYRTIICSSHNHDLTLIRLITDPISGSCLRFEVGH